jgi:type I restriction enzyme S subunit
MKSPWPTKKLGEICEERKEKNIKNLNLPVYAVSNIFGFVLSEEFFSKRVYSESLRNYKLVYKHDFAYNPARVNVGSLGLFREDDPGLISPMYIVFYIKDKNILNPLFLFYLLKTNFYQNKIKNLAASRGSIRQTLKLEDLLNLEIPLPPFPVQQKIVKILDTIQSAVEIQEKIIEKTKELKKSLMNLLFHYGLAGLRVKELMSSRVGELTSSEIEKLGLRLKKTEIGEIPEDWEVVRLGYKKIAEIKYGKRKPPEGGKIPVIGSSGIYDWTNKALIEKPTIVIGRKGTAGIPHLSMLPCWPSDTAFYLDLNLEKIYPKFLYEYILFRPLSGEHAKTTLPSLKREDLETFKIPLPPLPEQQEIAEILQTIDQKIEIEKKKKELYEELFKTMLNKIMSQQIDINLLDY